MQIRINDECLGIERPDADVVYISHAHADHVIRTDKDILASSETFRLIQRERSKNRKSGVKEPKHRPEMQSVELFPSGHMLGSTQIRMHNGKTIVYTGDFKLRDGFTVKAAPILQCDELIVDATFGNPAFKFPSRDAVKDSIINWINEKPEDNVIFGAYRMGKSQELIKLLNTAGIKPLVTPPIETVCKAYEELGMDLQRVVMGSEDSENVLNSNDRFVAIFPFNKVNGDLELEMSEVYGKTSCAVVTGWCLTRQFSVKAFPLSDHAGFEEILEYAEGSGAKKVICRFGEASRLVDALRRRGINSKWMP